VKKKSKLSYQDFSSSFMNGDSFKKIVVDNKLIDFPVDKTDNKFDYIKEVIKYRESINLSSLIFYVLCLVTLSFSTGTFSWNPWNLLTSLLITSLPFGFIYKFVDLAAQNQSLIEKAKPFIKSAYESYLKE
jgi:hypothetical protein